MRGGYIKLHRKIGDWEWIHDPPAFCLFMHLLLLANWKTSRYKGAVINRGQFVSGRVKLAKITGLSESQIRTAITKLKSTNEIMTDSSNGFTIFTITNYDSYQSDSNNNYDEISENTETTSTHGPLISPSEDLIFLCERVLGVANHLITWLNDCEYPPDWIEEALIKTESAGVRNPGYTRAILKNIKAQGGLNNTVTSNKETPQQRRQREIKEQEKRMIRKLGGLPDAAND